MKCTILTYKITFLILKIEVENSIETIIVSTKVGGE